MGWATYIYRVSKGEEGGIEGRREGEAEAGLQLGRTENWRCAWRSEGEGSDGVNENKWKNLDASNVHFLQKQTQADAVHEPTHMRDLFESSQVQNANTWTSLLNATIVANTWIAMQCNQCTQEKISGGQGYGRPRWGSGGQSPRTPEKFWKQIP